MKSWIAAVGAALVLAGCSQASAPQAATEGDPGAACVNNAMSSLSTYASRNGLNWLQEPFSNVPLTCAVVNLCNRVAPNEDLRIRLGRVDVGKETMLCPTQFSWAAFLKTQEAQGNLVPWVGETERMVAQMTPK